MTRFVILAVPRTGSNLLCTMLNSHPQILCHHEVFNPEGVFTALDYQGHGLDVDSLLQRDQDPLGFLDRVWQTGNGHSGVGFKWTRGQNEIVLKSVVQDARVRKIVLRRRNRVKTFISDMIAQKTQQWEVYSLHELATPRPRIHVEAKQLREHIAINQNFYSELTTGLSGNRQPFLEIEYETLFDPDAQARMLDFLDVAPDQPLTATSVKQNSMDLRDLISNFADLSGCLDDNSLKTELHDRGM